MRRRSSLAASLALLVTLAAGGAAYAGTTGHGDRPDCTPLQTGNGIGGAIVCPVNVDPDVAVDPIINLPIITGLQ